MPYAPEGTTGIKKIKTGGVVLAFVSRGLCGGLIISPKESYQMS
jgi:hypothetical protein